MRQIFVILMLCLVFSFNCFIVKKQFIIVSGSENITLEPMIKKFCEKNNINLEMKYKGSVDIMLELENEEIPYDAVWAANSMWISIGDKKNRVKHLKSIMISPVVFGIKKSIAQELGFINNKVFIKDIINAIQNKKLTFMMTSATQSNSGACAYLGFINAILGNPEIITKEHLSNINLKNELRKLFSGINRSSGSSGWLKDLFLSGDYDAMVNYESIIIETNLELISKGKEPLYVVYPVDGLVLADSPLGYINKNNNNKEKENIFKKIQEYLLSEEIQKEILKSGRRTGFGGIIENPDPKIFNKEWGIDTDKILSPIKLPSADVILEALNRYQSDFRKPSLTVYCLDFSGSMHGTGEKQLKQAMRFLLDQDNAKKYLIQLLNEDKTIIIPFDSEIMNKWEIEGNNKDKLNNILNNIINLSTRGGTDIYLPIIEGLKIIANEKYENYISAIVLMTDGKSETYNKNLFFQKYNEYNLDVPVFSIMFGSASKTQLEEIAKRTRGKVFDGTKDLINAFRSVKGYN